MALEKCTLTPVFLFSGISRMKVHSGPCFWQIVRHGKQRRMANAGLQAELYTAQELNRLMAVGCAVLHDPPGEKFNIDHVVIGPRAVYAIETKSVRKPRATDAKDHFKVVYDGRSLRFPDFVNTKKLHQTKRQAEWLSAYLNRPGFCRHPETSF